MRLRKSWIVTQKDMSIFWKNKYVLYSFILLPILFGAAFPALFIYSLSTEASSLPYAEFLYVASQTASTVTMYLVVVATVLPSILASYSFVSEKVEKSLEPLLATPTSDGELLLGKALGAFIPCMLATYIGALISTVIVDSWSYATFNVLFVPNLYWALVLFVIAPLASMMSVEANVIVSSRVNDIRAAQQSGGLISLPLILFAVYAGASAQSSLSLATYVTIVLAVVDVALFFLSKKTFQREEILTKWT